MKVIVRILSLLVLIAVGAGLILLLVHGALHHDNLCSKCRLAAVLVMVLSVPVGILVGIGMGRVLEWAWLPSDN